MQCFTEFVFEIFRNGPFTGSITISSIWKVFRTMFLKQHSVSIIPSVGYRMGDRQFVEALQWPAYIGRSRNNFSHAVNGREVHLRWVPYVKIY